MYKYYQLLDHKYNGLVVRSGNGKEEYYNTDDKQWHETGVMIRYYSDESDQYGMYKEISEKEALEAIG